MFRDYRFRNIQLIHYTFMEGYIMQTTKVKGSLIQIHTADLHFGAMDPRVQYELLMERLVNRVRSIPFDAFFINGDIFHHKFMANSDVIMYAMMFINEVIKLCIEKEATLVLLHGTFSHDADQLKLFYHHIGEPGLDLRIIENMRFEDIKGYKFLCIPEEYGKGEMYYLDKMWFEQDYDMAVLHGAVKGAIYGCNERDLNNPKAPVFDIGCFKRCRGPIICGHVHVPGCYQEHMYYCGSPLRWCFGEEQEKGFLVCAYSQDTGFYYVDFQSIESFRYDTICLDDMLETDPKAVIAYIIEKQNTGVDYIKIKFGQSTATTDAVKKYFNTHANVVIEVSDIGFKKVVEENQSQNDAFTKFKYLMGPNIDPYDIFCRYVNEATDGEFVITSDELVTLLLN